MITNSVDYSSNIRDPVVYLGHEVRDGIKQNKIEGCHFVSKNDMVPEVFNFTY